MLQRITMRKKRNKGFTVVEVLIAVLILLPVFVSVMYVFIRSMELSDMARHSSEAVREVRSRITDIENTPFAQVEHLIADQKLVLVDELVDKLGLNGLIVHINPMQEWFQSEGDLIGKAPVETISRLLDVAKYPVIVKEVGQGMGMGSLAALLQLPLAAIDFGASGGTNFALLELLRNRDDRLEELVPLVAVGHNADEMVTMVNELAERLGDRRLCQEVIISGGIRNFLDGYYLMGKCNLNAVYGQASAFLKHAMGSYEQLYKFVETQVEGLKMATAFLKVK